MAATSSDGLLRRWQHEGDRGALDELLRRELPRLRARLQRDEAGLAGTSVGATDAVQEAALRMVEREPELEFRGVAPLRAFLFSTARRYLVDRFRRRRRKRALEEPELLRAPGDEALAATPLDDVLGALRALEFRQREVIELAYLHGMEPAALGRELRISADAARMRVARATERLRELLDERSRPADASTAKRLRTRSTG